MNPLVNNSVFLLCTVLLWVDLAVAETRVLMVGQATSDGIVRFSSYDGTEISSNQIAKVTSWPSGGDKSVLGVAVIGHNSTGAGRANFSLDFWRTNTVLPIVVPGPAFITLQTLSGTAMTTCSIEVTDKNEGAKGSAAMIPIGQGARVTLETSTDLATWAATAPGLFTNAPSARFFRIRMDAP